MPNLLNRIASLPADIYQRVTRSQLLAQSANRASPLTQPSDYDLRDMLLAGTMYQTVARGGALKWVLRSIGKPTDETKYPITPYFNPVRQIVDFYSNTLAGSLGKEITLADEVNGVKISRLVNDPLSRVWRWSNLDTRKGELTELAANQGTVGIRICYAPLPTPRVYLDFDHPSFIKRVDKDARGNMTSVFLEYDAQRYDGAGSLQTVKVKEIISKEGFSRTEDEVETISPEQQQNPLGLCPYVLLRHDLDAGNVFGRHAYHGSEYAIHGINYGLTQLDESVAAHVWPYLFASGGGNKPQKFITGRYTMIYTKSGQGVPQATFDTLVPDLDFDGAIKHLVQLADWFRERQPEMTLNALSLLSGVSGETLQQVLKPAESACLRARALYEDAIVRAVQIAFSFGIFYAVPGFDFGTGLATKEAADRAYDDGQGPEAFAFAERNALPITPAAAISQAQASQAKRTQGIMDAKAADGIVSNAEQLRMIGYTPEEIAEIQREKAEQDVIPTEPDGTLPADEVDQQAA